MRTTKGKLHKRRLLATTFCVTFSCLCLSASLARAEEKIKDLPQKYKIQKNIPRNYGHSSNLTGMVGLNTIPTARMDKKGTVRLGVGTTDPYVHSFIGFQLAKPFYVSLRQTSEVSSLAASPDAFYPGVDFKLRLVEETETRPAIAIGMDSAFGHKRMASEYLTLSKRYKNFDITGGMAWGRLGSAGHMKNPLRAISSHFENNRDFTAPFKSQDINGWFTGQDVGFFGGVEYHTPVNGLSLKADYGANDYIGENTISGFNAPDPWAISLNYKPIEPADISVGVIGGEKVMARLSLQDKIFNWPGKPTQKIESPNLQSPRPYNKETDEDEQLALNLSSHRPTALQIGQISRLIANQSSSNTEHLQIALRHKGLKGPVVTLMRKDLEQALIEKSRSPEEIWNNAEIEEDTSPNFNWKKLLQKNIFNKDKYVRAFKLIFDQKLSVSESDAGILYRTSVILETEKSWPLGLTTGASARVNLANNLSNLNDYRFRAENPVRSDEDLFAARRFGIDRFYATWMKSLSPSTHISLNTGYLEEMYGGYGGEILYRPFGKRFALGAEGWRIHKRDPTSAFNKIMSDQGTFTGHLNLFYEMPDTNMTTYLKVGQYLRTDRGATFGLKNTFENGSSLEGYITATNQPNADLLGNKTHAFGGVRFNLPLGNIPYVPDGSEIRFTTEPFARDSGQILDKPHPLYEATEPIAYRSLNQSWKHLLD